MPRSGRSHYPGMAGGRSPPGRPSRCGPRRRRRRRRGCAPRPGEASFSTMVAASAADWAAEVLDEGGLEPGVDPGEHEDDGDGGLLDLGELGGALLPPAGADEHAVEELDPQAHQEAAHDAADEDVGVDGGEGGGDQAAHGAADDRAGEPAVGVGREPEHRGGVEPGLAGLGRLAQGDEGGEATVGDHAHAQIAEEERDHREADADADGQPAREEEVGEGLLDGGLVGLGGEIFGGLLGGHLGVLGVLDDGADREIGEELEHGPGGAELVVLVGGVGLEGGRLADGVPGGGGLGALAGGGLDGDAAADQDLGRLLRRLGSVPGQGDVRRLLLLGDLAVDAALDGLLLGHLGAGVGVVGVDVGGLGGGLEDVDLGLQLLGGDHARLRRLDALPRVVGEVARLRVGHDLALGDGDQEDDRRRDAEHHEQRRDQGPAHLFAPRVFVHAVGLRVSGEPS